MVGYPRQTPPYDDTPKNGLDQLVRLPIQTCLKKCQYGPLTEKLPQPDIFVGGLHQQMPLYDGTSKMD